MEHSAYIRQEMSFHHEQIREIETEPAEAQKAAAHDLLTKWQSQDGVERFAADVADVLRGEYGDGARIEGEAIARNKRMNRPAALSTLTAELSMQIKNSGVRSVWGKLTKDEQERLAGAIMGAIERSLAEQMDA